MIKKEPISFENFFELFRQTEAGHTGGSLQAQSEQILSVAEHGDFEKWLTALAELPDVSTPQIDFNCAAVRIGKAQDIQDPAALQAALIKLHPWRKGPFDFFGIFVDAEWRSDLKWARIEKQIQPLAGRTILDLGCGNGYYLWRMLGCGAKLALGIDPSLQYLIQFQMVQKYIQDSRAALLPLGVEDLPGKLTGFDTVFSMGLLYHRRDPLEHLQQIHSLLCKDGELVLETLVVDGDAGHVLNPKERYAKMRNVWHIPTCKTAEAWLKQAGFKNVRCVDVTLTTRREQRKTDWMQFESLEDFLDPSDVSKTVEGYPAPTRAVFIAQK